MTVLLHGFWGQPQDWNEVLKRVGLGVNVICPDLYEDGPLGPKHDLNTWTKNFHSWLAHEAGRSVDRSRRLLHGSKACTQCGDR